MSEDTKKLILDISEKLFYEKGYDNTSIAEIVKETNIARGTLYYYFAKKEDILDAVIERQGEKVFANAKKIAADKSHNAADRLINTIIAMHKDGKQEDRELDQVHSPQNALMHQKVNDYIVKNATPFLTQIIEDGIKENIFDTKFPRECIEMILIYVNVGFDHMAKELTEEEKMIKFQAFFYNINKLLGAKEGSLNFAKIMGEI